MGNVVHSAVQWVNAIYSLFPFVFHAAQKAQPEVMDLLVKVGCQLPVILAVKQRLDYGCLCLYKVDVVHADYQGFSA